MMDPATGTLALLDYRRRVADVYRTVRISPPGAAAWNGWRIARDELFATHPHSPLDEGDERRRSGLRYADYDPAWRFELKVEPEEPVEVHAEHSGPGSTPLKRFGRVRLPIDAGPTLNLFRFEQYADGIFLAFRDGSSGTSTYGGGRYLLDSPKGADLGHDGEQLVLDFNYAYHPSCVYSDRWSCPLPPRDNWLHTSIPVGEQL
ncbi:MAG: DUF1684 domain-containing protein [Actinomycetia bacterium]|nr:DUF1684 domain-containing protein [Actinomycetes bacterium]